MMEWVLVLYIYAGVWAKGDSVAITTVAMNTQEACEKAAANSEGLVKGSAKEIRHVCLKVK
jgi:hypothetical protein